MVWVKYMSEFEVIGRFKLPTRTSMSVHLSSVQDYSTLLDTYDTWMFDCDGVLWHGDRLINGAVEVLELLRSKSTHPLIDSDYHIIHRIAIVFSTTRQEKRCFLSQIMPLNRGKTTRGNLTSWEWKHM